MRIDDRFERQENEDIIILGDMIEQFMRSEMGQLFKIMLRNLQKLELQNSRTPSSSADRSLGRIESYDTILNDLQAFIDRKAELQRPIEIDRNETPEAEEQTVALRGGEI